MDSKGKTVQYYLEHKDEITIPDWNPKPILMPPPSPKKSVPLKAGAGLERAAMSLKSKREDRESKEGGLSVNVIRFFGTMSPMKTGNYRPFEGSKHNIH